MMNGEEFKMVRHRFYHLGKTRNNQILLDLGKKSEGEILSHDEMKAALEDLNAEGRVFDLLEAIQNHEEEIEQAKEQAQAGPA